MSFEGERFLYKSFYTSDSPEGKLEDAFVHDFSKKLLTDGFDELSDLSEMRYRLGWVLGELRSELMGLLEEKFKFRHDSPKDERVFERQLLSLYTEISAQIAGVLFVENIRMQSQLVLLENHLEVTSKEDFRLALQILVSSSVMALVLVLSSTYVPQAIDRLFIELRSGPPTSLQTAVSDRFPPENKLLSLGNVVLPDPIDPISSKTVSSVLSALDIDPQPVIKTAPLSPPDFLETVEEMDSSWSLPGQELEKDIHPDTDIWSRFEPVKVDALGPAPGVFEPPNIDKDSFVLSDICISSSKINPLLNTAFLVPSERLVFSEIEPYLLEQDAVGIDSNGQLIRSYDQVIIFAGLGSRAQSILDIQQKNDLTDLFEVKYLVVRSGGELCLWRQTNP